MRSCRPPDRPFSDLGPWPSEAGPAGGRSRRGGGAVSYDRDASAGRPRRGRRRRPDRRKDGRLARVDLAGDGRLPARRPNEVGSAAADEVPLPVERRARQLRDDRLLRTGAGVEAADEVGVAARRGNDVPVRGEGPPDNAVAAVKDDRPAALGASGPGARPGQCRRQAEGDRQGGNGDVPDGRGDEPAEGHSPRRAAPSPFPTSAGRETRNRPRRMSAGTSRVMTPASIVVPPFRRSVPGNRQPGSGLHPTLAGLSARRTTDTVTDTITATIGQSPRRACAAIAVSGHRPTPTGGTSLHVGA